MKKINSSLLMLVVFFVTSCSNISVEKEITISTLLNEIVDREQIAEFPTNNYKSLQASSYNRESVSSDKPGWFADSDGIGFIRTEENNGKKEWVIMEDDGPGVITKIWAVCFYYGFNNKTGPNINIYLDGEITPTISTNFFKLIKGLDFVKAPLADESARAGNLYFPIPYAKSCKITMDNKASYNIINYRKYPTGTKVKTFSMEAFKQTSELQKKVAHVLDTRPEPKGEKTTIVRTLEKGDQIAMSLDRGLAIKQLEIKLDKTEDMAQALRSVALKATFDGEQTVWVPVGDFFNNVGKVRAYDMWERSVKANGTMVCRWVMPFEKEAQLYLENMGDLSVKAKLTVTTDEYKWTENSMHFYATWQMDDPVPTFPLFDYNFLEAQGKGVIVGDEWSVLNPIEGWWGEGDEKIYIDNDIEKNFPSHFGTGTEDYYGWAGGVVPTPTDEFAKPFLGNIIVGEQKSKGYNVCTRTRVLDAIPFNKQIQFDIESSCGKRSKSHFLQYAQTTFWYGIPGVKHNREPLPEFASAKLPSIEDLEKEIEKAKGSQYIVEGALEAELLPIIEKSDKVKENFSEIPMWGEISSGSMKNIWFEQPGDFAELKITEQFEKSKISICAAVGPNSGSFDVYVNGIKKITQDFYTHHEGITNPYLDLGDCEPLNNAFIVRFEYKGNHLKSRSTKNKHALGLDFFLIDNNFMNRN
ncbi:glycoside hydrolase family 172 protein [Flavivirga spongiicola]|uniref:DUF2961 domain-containing protein n=1 Tax=Flavivirga spongiicola TaxID=421621 RepID=A0ABU7XZ30_9FLAO|nr:glycoside hydrolase family 172 protein [Flavivirga sp. MEBiC05379]MDO5980191.1 DUF2961 domain-containing protein [Flavivirga sp. MEBiC05379]